IAALTDTAGEVDEAVAREYKEKFVQVMGNDLNTSMGITAVYDVLKAKTNDVTKRAILGSFDQVLGLSLLEKAAQLREKEAAQAKTQTQCGYTVTGEGDPAVDELVLARYEAKKAKNFAEADRIRDELKAQGVEITDVPGGAVWKRV
ncbi:MAG: cysteine--tRNA ligase, partial [Oscillospiraceae bacterium]|nr:cysteine--tRNA ligase [Oscillospiraceae bacterium]